MHGAIAVAFACPLYLQVMTTSPPPASSPVLRFFSSLGMPKSINLTTRVLLWFYVVSLVPLLLLIGCTLYISSAQLEAIMQSHLDSVATDKEQQIINYV